MDVRPVALISAATVRGLSEELGRGVDAQRFRSNLVLALEGDLPFGEDALQGAALYFGRQDKEKAAVLRVLERIPRCRMVSLDPDTTEPDPALLRHLARCHEGRVGVYARVERTGTVRVGDGVWV